MDKVRQALMECALERAAEQLGDVTPLVMADFHARFPDARAMFEHHAPHGPDRLEAEMVDNALYCLMTWFHSRAEIEIILYTSVPHHQETLKVPSAWYAGLIGATIDVLLRSTPADAADELAMWADLRADFDRLVAHSMES